MSTVPAPGDFSPWQMRLFVPAEQQTGPATFQPPADLSPSMSLAQLYVAFVRPLHVAQGDSPGNIKQLDESLGKWVRFTGDPSLARISDATAMQFVTGLWTLPGIKRGSTIMAATVNKHCRTVQSILDRAGPRDRRTNPKGQGLIADVPLIERPRVPKIEVNRNLTLAEIGQLLRACPQLETTALDYGPFPGWWSAAIRFDYNVGIRFGALVQLRFSWLHQDEMGTWITIPEDTPDIKVSARKGYFLNSSACAAVEEMRAKSKPGEDRIFAWDVGESWLYNLFRRLMAIAGIPAERSYRVKFHGLRRAMGTELAKINGLAAKMALGHTGRDVTIDHYVHRVVLAESLAKLPQPSLD